MEGNGLRVALILALLTLVLGLGTAILGIGSSEPEVRDYNSCVEAGHAVSGSVVCTDPSSNKVYYRD